MTGGRGYMRKEQAAPQLSGQATGGLTQARHGGGLDQQLSSWSVGMTSLWLPDARAHVNWERTAKARLCHHCSKHAINPDQDKTTAGWGSCNTQCRLLCMVLKRGRQRASRQWGFRLRDHHQGSLAPRPTPRPGRLLRSPPAALTSLTSLSASESSHICRSKAAKPCPTTSSLSSPTAATVSVVS